MPLSGAQVQECLPGQVFPRPVSSCPALRASQVGAYSSCDPGAHRCPAQVGSGQLAESVNSPSETQ